MKKVNTSFDFVILDFLIFVRTKEDFLLEGVDKPLTTSSKEKVVY